MNDLNQLFEDKEKTKLSSHLAVYILSAFLLILAAIFAFYAYNQYLSLNKSTGPASGEKFFTGDGNYMLDDYHRKDSTVSEPGKAQALGGKLLLSAVPADVQSGIPTVFILDIAKNQLYPMNKKAGWLIPSYKQDKNMAVFTAVNLSARFKDKSKAFDLYTNTKTRLSAENATKVLDKRLSMVFHLDMNQDSSAILFNTSSDGKIPSKVEDWQIYLYSFKDSSLKKLGKGLYPQWVGMGKFVYLDNKGLRIYDLKKSKSESLWPLKKGVAPDMRFNVDKSGTKIAWTVPEDKILAILSFADKEKRILKQERLLQGVLAYSPMWSPDGRVISFVKKEPAKSGIMFYDYKDNNFLNSPVSVVPLHKFFRLNTITLSDWVN